MSNRSKMPLHGTQRFRRNNGRSTTHFIPFIPFMLLNMLPAATPFLRQSVSRKSKHFANISLDSISSFGYIWSSMAKQEKQKKRGRGALQTSAVPFSKLNYWLFAAAAVVLALGYWALAQPPVDGFLTLTLAPILLVIGYCVLIPLAIMINEKREASPEQRT